MQTIQLWTDICRIHPYNWVVLTEVKYTDPHGLHVERGRLLFSGNTQSAMMKFLGEYEASLTDDELETAEVVCIHTSEGAEQDGLLKSYH